jgi:RNA polymerase-interacting CarD/CdnL/TRCF family regulator
MTAELRSLIGEIKRNQLDLSGTIEEVAEMLSEGDPQRIAELVSTLSEQDKSLRESVAHFADSA